MIILTEELIHFLLDPDAEAGARHDIVMELSELDDQVAEDALILIACDPKEDFLHDQVGESIGIIWLRKQKILPELLANFTDTARYTTVNLLCENHSMLEELYNYLLRNSSSTQKLAENTISLLLNHYEYCEKSQDFVKAQDFAMKSIKLISQHHQKSKILDFYKLALMMYLRHKNESIIELAKYIATACYPSPETQFQHDTLVYINFITNFQIQNEGKALKDCD